MTSGKLTQNILRAVTGVLLILALVTAVAERQTARASEAAPVVSTTIAPVTTTTTAAPTTTVTAPITTLAPAPPVTPAPTAPRPRPTVAPTRQFASVADAGLRPYAGLGTWVDVYDWSQTYTRDGNPATTIADLDRMASVGVQTIYLQASKHDAPTDVLEPERLVPMIQRAHELGMKVVAWYLPTFVDPAKDLQRLLAIAALPVDGLGVDIEARNVTDTAERNRRLVQLSVELRQALPGRTLDAIVLPPVVTDVINTNYWPDFPWGEIAPLYDVWQPMGYWTNRKESSGWRNAHDYTVENVVRLRRHIGRPDAPVHAVGGIGDKTTLADIDGFVRAAAETFSIGGSLYDWRTTRPDHWAAQQPLRAAG